jgi:SAM-dependent methyltransferase
MLLEASQLSGFYGTPSGAAARRSILLRIRHFWPEARGLRMLGYGFAVPYLKPYLADAERVVGLMPAQTGILAWPPGAAPLTVMAEEGALPFADAFFDRIVVVHGLEGAESVRLLLRQLWRVLAPEGRLLVVAPNRVSLWAMAEASPFACGRPFRKGELDALLRDTLFEPLRWDRALYMAPRKDRKSVQTALWWERLGGRLWPALSGVHLVEARKSLYGLTPVQKKKKSETVLAHA